MIVLKYHSSQSNGVISILTRCVDEASGSGSTLPFGRPDLGPNYFQRSSAGFKNCH